MKGRRFGRMLFGVIVGCLFLGGLFFLLHGGPQTFAASGTTRFVTPDGTGTACSQAAPCALQTALARAADGDVIYLGRGTYTGVGPAVITISRSITLYGGWDGAPTGPVVRDPRAYPTVLDGEGRRRVIYITGKVSPTLDGLTIVRGNATRAPDLPGYGGGICSFGAKPIIVNCTIRANIATTAPDKSGSGGGILITAPSGRVVISGNRVISNTAAVGSMGTGGGIELLGAAEARVLNNVVMNNTATLSATRGYGGGIAISGRSANTLMQGNVLRHNTAIRQGDDTRRTQAYGGGIYVGSHSVVISANVVLSNTAIITGGSGSGGGIAVMGSDDAVLVGNRVEYNIAQRDATRIPSNRGGGIYCLSGNHVVLRENVIRHNSASISNTGAGGGVDFSSCNGATLVGNTVADNVASHNGNGYGGGFHAYASQGLRINANEFLNNTASLSPWGRGGGLYFSRKTVFTMTNNIVAANYARREGGGVAFETSARSPVTGTLVHNTFVANDRGRGNGRIAVHLNDPYVTLVLTNNLIYSHTYGVYAVDGSTATLYNTLFYANSSGDTGGPGSITNVTPITGRDPLLTRDYHLRGSSPAIDAGRPMAWLRSDVDGDARPKRSGYDIGADEYMARFYLPRMPKHHP